MKAQKLRFFSLWSPGFNQQLRGSRRLPAKRSRPMLAGLQIEALEDRTVLSTIVALTSTDALVTFDSANPPVILNSTPITGLEPGDSLVGIDVRPATGELYGIGGSNRLYTINANTGAVITSVALTANLTDLSNPFSSLDGTNFGIDFNPVVDRLRVVSDANQNLRINPNDGTVLTDEPLAYDAADPNFGSDPLIVDAAYSNNFAGATTTTLFEVDANLHKLVTQGGVDGVPSPNAGQLFTVGEFAKAGVVQWGFDIAPDGTAFSACELVFGPGDFDFVLVEYGLAGQTIASQGRIGDGTTRIRDIAVAPGLRLSTDLYAVREGTGPVTVTVTRTDGGVGTFTVNVTAISATAQVRADFTPTAQTLTFAPGETVKTVTIAINDDDTPELDEIFVVTLSNPTGGAVLGGPNTAVVRISANDSDDVTGPQVTRIGLTGPSRGITGAVVHFNEDLDPATAQNPDNYTLTGTGLRGGSQRLKFSSAVYDLATRTVTLQAAQPFIQTQFRQFDFRVNGKRGGVTDAIGNLLDGNERGKSGGDATLKFKVFTGLTVSITDRDGDQATLVLDVGGSIDGILPIKAPKTQLIQFWLLDVISLESTLTGTIKKGPKGNGIIVIAEIIGIDKKEFKPTTLLRGFVFNTITHSPIAGGR